MEEKLLQGGMKFAPRNFSEKKIYWEYINNVTTFSII